MADAVPLWPKEYCSGCVFLGNHLGRDLYACGDSSGVTRVLVQYGAEPREYASYFMYGIDEYRGTYSDSGRVAAELAKLLPGVQ